MDVDFAQDYDPQQQQQQQQQQLENYYGYYPDKGDNPFLFPQLSEIPCSSGGSGIIGCEPPSDDSFPDEMQLLKELRLTPTPAPAPPSRRKHQVRMLLWQFLLLQLLRGHSSLAWVEDQWSRPGVFKFTDTNEAARQWGSHKGNRNMSYEKMSRCVRDYYTRRANKYFGVMLPDGRGQEHRRAHFAFNLQNPDVLRFIRAHREDYYWSLVKKEIVKHHS